MLTRYALGAKTPDGGIVEGVRVDEVFVRYPNGFVTWVPLERYEQMGAPAPQTTDIPAPRRGRGRPRRS